MASDNTKINTKRAERLKERGVIIDWKYIYGEKEFDHRFHITLLNNVVIAFRAKELAAFYLGAMSVYSAYEDTLAVLTSASFKGFEPEGE